MLHHTGKLDRHLIHGSLGPREPTHRTIYLASLAGFMVVTDRETCRLTDHATLLVVSRILLVLRCGLYCNTCGLCYTSEVGD